MSRTQFLRMTACLRELVDWSFWRNNLMESIWSCFLRRGGLKFILIYYDDDVIKYDNRHLKSCSETPPDVYDTNVKKELNDIKTNRIKQLNSV